jgi:hypothetical protein
MDIDKPHQLELLRADLEKQQRRAAAKAKRAAKAETCQKNRDVKNCKKQAGAVQIKKTVPAIGDSGQSFKDQTTAKAKPRKK